ncbi:hypothetical protein VTK73DRAFT_1963 [Phialemonium thermophilum]|uniref:Uncharacterized protein n=1 Tax=Phialemonium thermophilum TaxID=223376 RepID=A0ABR3VSU5_9PEZI
MRPRQARDEVPWQERRDVATMADIKLPRPHEHRLPTVRPALSTSDQDPPSPAIVEAEWRGLPSRSRDRPSLEKRKCVPGRKWQTRTTWRRHRTTSGRDHRSGLQTPIWQAMHPQKTLRRPSPTKSGRGPRWRRKSHANRRHRHSPIRGHGYQGSPNWAWGTCSQYR